MRLLQPFFVSLALILAVPCVAQDQPTSPQKPPPPPKDIPDLRTVKPFIVCGDCDQPFDSSTHNEVLDELVSNKYIGELRKALYWQDTYHQFESKAHFDNCDFENGTAYIDGLLTEIDGHVSAAKAAQGKDDHAAVEASMLKAFFALGQALHGVQDFYAHSNYVELSVGQVKKSTDIAIVSPWKKIGKDRIKDLTSKGLVSGYVFWGFPQKCPKDTPAHADMAKDKTSTPNGAVKVPHLENRSRYQIAVQLAREASKDLIDDAFQRWPLLKDVNGNQVAFEVLVDRRGL